LIGFSRRGITMPFDTFTLGDLTAIFGDNDAKGDHRAGYNGIKGFDAEWL
jgi:hypothetical protein